MKIERIFVEDVDAGNRLRAINEWTVMALAESMQRLGQLSPISVYRLDEETLRLVAGLDRLEAAKRLGWIEIEAVFATGNEIERELQEIAENLHRSELTVPERDSQIGRWAELTAVKVAQVGTHSRVTTWRNVKRGHLKLVYVGSTPMVPRSEAIRLGLIDE
jgi:hypothetical protein